MHCVFNFLIITDLILLLPSYLYYWLFATPLVVGLLTPQEVLQNVPGVCMLL